MRIILLKLKLFSLLFIVMMISTGCRSNYNDISKFSGEEVTECGNSTIEGRLTEDAKQNLIHIMGTYEDLYKSADRGESVNVVLEDNVIKDIQVKLAESGLTVYTSVPYQNMLGGDKMDQFLKQCMKGIPGSQTIYQVHYDGGLSKQEYRFDGKEMQLFSVIYSWDASQTSVITQMDFYRMEYGRQSFLLFVERKNRI